MIAGVLPEVYGPGRGSDSENLELLFEVEEGACTMVCGSDARCQAPRNTESETKTMRSHETKTGHKIAKPHTSARRNTRPGMLEFVIDSTTGGIGSETHGDAVAAACPKAAWEFVSLQAALVRGLVADSTAGRVIGGDDVFQDTALAELQGEPVRYGLRRALDRDRKRAARGQIAGTIDGEVIDNHVTEAEPDQPLRDSEAQAIGLVWDSLTPKERWTVRQAMAGRPESLETVRGALVHAGFGSLIEAARD